MEDDNIIYKMQILIWSLGLLFVLIYPIVGFISILKSYLINLEEKEEIKKEKYLIG